MDLSDWFHDFLNKKLDVKEEEEEEEDDEDEDSDSDLDGEMFLDPDWYSGIRHVKKYIPSLSSIALGVLVKMINTTATSDNGSEQLRILKKRLPQHLVTRLLPQLSFRALMVFLELPSVSSYFDLNAEVPLTTLLGCIKQEEDLYRYLYHLHPAHPFLQKTESSVLLNVFDNYDAFKYGKSDQLDAIPVISAFMKLYKAKSGSSINDRATFEARWAQLTNSIFVGFDWSNVFVAGGAVLHCLRSFTDEEFNSIVNNGADPEDEGDIKFSAHQPDSIFEWDGEKYRKLDIDMFIYGLDAQKTKEKVTEIYESILKVEPQAHAAVTKNTVTIFGPRGFKPIQIILCLHKSPAEVLLNFDLNCVAVGFNGQNVLALPKFLLAMKYGRNYLDSNMNTAAKLQYFRLLKYAARGFPTALPVHFRMHGYFDQEIPSQDEIAEDPKHPVYYYISEILHLAKLSLLTHRFGSEAVEVFHWEDLWQRGITRNGKRRAGPKGNKFRGLALPIKEEEDLTPITSKAMRPFYQEGPRYESNPIDFNKDLKHNMDNIMDEIFTPEDHSSLVIRLQDKNILPYNDNEGLQPFYLNSCVATATYKPDLDEFANPYAGINTSLASVEYITKTIGIDIEGFSNIEYGKIHSDPFDLSGYKWKLTLESGKGRPIIFAHLQKLVAEDDSNAILPSFCAANFLISFKEKGQAKKSKGKDPSVTLDGTKIFTDASNTWTTFLHGPYIDPDAKNPYGVEVNKENRSIQEDTVHMEVTIQALKITTPAIAF